jgi:hypothetical protein
VSNEEKTVKATVKDMRKEKQELSKDVVSANEYTKLVDQSVSRIQNDFTVGYKRFFKMKYLSDLLSRPLTLRYQVDLTGGPVLAYLSGLPDREWPALYQSNNYTYISDLV